MWISGFRDPFVSRSIRDFVVGFLDFQPSGSRAERTRSSLEQGRLWSVLYTCFGEIGVIGISGAIGIMEKTTVTSMVYWGYGGIMDRKAEATRILAVSLCSPVLAVFLLQVDFSFYVLRSALSASPC